MRLLSSTILIITFLSACASDDVVRSEKKNFEVYKNITKKSFSEDAVTSQSSTFPNTKKWLEKFSQPIILTSSIDKKNQATLVVLGDNRDRLTWVSSDGISLSYDNGILIATRGYSQDLYLCVMKSQARYFHQIIPNTIRPTDISTEKMDITIFNLTVLGQKRSHNP